MPTTNFVDMQEPCQLDMATERGAVSKDRANRTVSKSHANLSYMLTEKELIYLLTL